MYRASKTNLTGSRQSGQIVLEYILLLVIGVGAAAVITSTMVSRSPESPGFLITKWMDIIGAVGNDPADDLNN